MIFLVFYSHYLYYTATWMVIPWANYGWGRMESHTYIVCTKIYDCVKNSRCLLVKFLNTSRITPINDFVLFV